MAAAMRFNLDFDPSDGGGTLMHNVHAADGDDAETFATSVATLVGRNLVVVPHGGGDRIPVEAGTQGTTVDCPSGLEVKA